MRLLAPLAFFAAIGCNSSPKEGPASPAVTIEPARDATSAPAPAKARPAEGTLGSAKAPDDAAPAPRSGDVCMKACQERNMMRAVSADQIEFDCRRECKLEVDVGP